jgi:hypothetical protein
MSELDTSACARGLMVSLTLGVADMSRISLACLGLLLIAAPAAPLSAQVPAQDPSARLREVLPADVAERVLARIADARAHALPAAALAQRALKFAAKGVAPAEIERSVAEQAERMAVVRTSLDDARRAHPAAPDEIEAGAEAMRQGIDGAAVSALARSAPSGRSLTVPFYVLGALSARGLPADQALARVEQMLAARASDAALEGLPDQVRGPGGRAGGIERDLPAAGRPAGGRGVAGDHPGGGPPAGVPANAGRGARPTRPNHPKHP